MYRVDMDAAQLEHYRTILFQLRDELRSSLSQVLAATSPVSPDKAIGRLTRLEAMQSQQMALEMKRRQEGRLRLVELALEKIKKGVYGTCLRCEEEIAPNRLKAHPETPVCVRCAERRSP
jgi:DnaK suppressor protein